MGYSKYAGKGTNTPRETDNPNSEEIYHPAKEYAQHDCCAETTTARTRRITTHERTPVGDEEACRRN